MIGGRPSSTDARRSAGRIAARSAAAGVVVVGLLVAASCGSDGRIERTGRATASTAAAPSSTAPSPTSSLPDTTTTSADTTSPESTVLVPPATAPPVLPGDGALPTSPPPEVIRPPAAWVGFGIPQPGSMFENLQADRSLDGRGKFVALTFDDGPSQYTQPIVDILRLMWVQATFFQISTQAEARPDLVRAMAASGMRIGAHTARHPHLAEIPPAEQDLEVSGSIDVLNGILGPGAVKCFRPPYAQYDQHVLDLAASKGAATAMWSLDTLDWQQPSWLTMAQRVINGATDRSVILLHDGGGDRTNTIAALPWIIQGLRDRGFQFLPIC